MSGSSSVTVKKFDEVEKIVHFSCTMCDNWSFTVNGLRYHMFAAHNIHDNENLSPRLLEGANVSLSSDSSMPNIVGPSQRKQSKEEEDKLYKCTLCRTHFFYQSSIHTHIVHAHSDEGTNKSYARYEDTS